MWKQPRRLYGSSWLGRQVSSGSPREGDVDVAKKHALCQSRFLLRQSVRKADADFVSCPTFHLIALTVRVSLRLANRPSLAGYWKFNTSLLDIRDFRDRLKSLIKRALVRAVTGNRWWISLKHRMRYFATKYGRQLNLDRNKRAKSIEDRLSRAMAEGDSLTVELARRDLERETSERYKGFVVRSRLKRVQYEAVKSNATACEEEVRRFLDWYIDSVKSPDGRILRSNPVIGYDFRDRFARCPDLPFQEFCRYLVDLGLLKRLAVRVWLLYAKSVMHWSISRTRWFALRSLLEAAAHVCAYSDG